MLVQVFCPCFGSLWSELQTDWRLEIPSDIPPFRCCISSGVDRLSASPAGTCSTHNMVRLNRLQPRPATACWTHTDHLLSYRTLWICVGKRQSSMLLVDTLKHSELEFCLKLARKFSDKVWQVINFAFEIEIAKLQIVFQTATAVRTLISHE